MQLLNHRCPACEFTAPAPCPAIAEGDAGIWQCERCNRAFQLYIEFTLLEPPKVEKSRTRLREHQAGAQAPALWQEAPPEDPAQQQAEDAEARLAEIASEMADLRGVLHELEEEAGRLSEAKSF